MTSATTIHHSNVLYFYLLVNYIFLNFIEGIVVKSSRSSINLWVYCRDIVMICVGQTGQFCQIPSHHRNQFVIILQIKVRTLGPIL